MAASSSTGNDSQPPPPPPPSLYDPAQEQYSHQHHQTPASSSFPPGTINSCLEPLPSHPSGSMSLEEYPALLETRRQRLGSSEIQMEQQDYFIVVPIMGIFKGVGEPQIGFSPHFSTQANKSFARQRFDMIVAKSKGAFQEIQQSYIAAMNDDILKIVRDCYRDGNGRIISITLEKLRLQMIHGGCSMLVTSLCCLGYSPATEGNEVTFEEVWTPLSQEDSLKSIFFPGNQICILVLQKLLQQDFFKEIIGTTQWRKPTNLLEIVLYQCLLKPNISDKNCIFNWKEYEMHGQPLDVLHALHILVLGRSNNLHSGLSTIVGEQNCPTATELTKKGIRFKGVKDIGIEEINVTDTCLGRRRLDLPFLFSGEHMDIVIQMLTDYEISPNFNLEDRKVTSFFGLCKSLIVELADTKILADSGVIEDNVIFRTNLVATLANMTLPTTSEHMKNVKLQLIDYAEPKWRQKVVTFSKLLVSIGGAGGIFAIIEYIEKKLK